MARHKHLDPSKLLSSDQVEKLATAAIEAAEGQHSTTTGAERHALAVDAFLDKLDGALKWGSGPAGLLLEAIDGPAIHLLWTIAGSVIQNTFEKWQAKRAAARETY